MEKQRGFPETVARKATDEDMDGSRATLRVLARSHVFFEKNDTAYLRTPSFF